MEPIFLLIKLVIFHVSEEQVQNTNFIIQKFMEHFYRGYIEYFYKIFQKNHGSIWLDIYLDNNRFFTSTVCLFCGCISIYGGSDSTSVWTVSKHLIQFGFSSDNEISTSLNNFKRRCMVVKDTGHRTDTLNLETTFVFLA